MRRAIFGLILGALIGGLIGTPIPGIGATESLHSSIIMLTVVFPFSVFLGALTGLIVAVKRIQFKWRMTVLAVVVSFYSFFIIQEVHQESQRHARGLENRERLDNFKLEFARVKAEAEKLGARLKYGTRVSRSGFVIRVEISDSDFSDLQLDQLREQIRSLHDPPTVPISLEIDLYDTQVSNSGLEQLTRQIRVDVLNFGADPVDVRNFDTPYTLRKLLVVCPV